MSYKKLKVKYSKMENSYVSDLDEPLNLTMPLNLTTPPVNLESTKMQPKIKRPADDKLEQVNMKTHKMVEAEPVDKKQITHIKIVYCLPGIRPTAVEAAPKFSNGKKISRCKKSAGNMSAEIRQLIEKKSKVQNGKEITILGPNYNSIERIRLEKIDWRKSSSAIARNILKEIFGVHILSTHNLSGKKSPAFYELNMPEKGQLDPSIIADLVNFMELTLNMTEKEVKEAVTAACADAGKKTKQRRISENTPTDLG